VPIQTAGLVDSKGGFVSIADRVIRACGRLSDLYGELFLAEQLAPTQQARQGGPSATGHAPARLDVLDQIREVNGAVLGLRLELAVQFGFPEHDLPAPGYSYDHRVLDSLEWIGAAAYTLESEGLADQVLGVLSDGPDALLPAVRRLLGMSTRAWPYPTMPCPAGDCTGNLVALPDHWLVVCSTRHPEHRWGPADWEGLGRSARAKADEQALVAT
jgi:hypothetical protein